MALQITAERLLAILRDTIVGTVRRDGPDLSARQFGVFLITYIEEGPHTVRGLASRLDVSKPAITRSLDRLAELGLAKRGPDPRDRRSVLVQRTRKGQDFLVDVGDLLNSSSKGPVAKAPIARASTPKVVTIKAAPAGKDAPAKSKAKAAAKVTSAKISKSNAAKATKGKPTKAKAKATAPKSVPRKAAKSGRRAA
jgi:DNA-binding MarR family transcriptional regulator